jgi:hypothetical protein
MANRNPSGERARQDRMTDHIGLGVLTRLIHRDLVDEVLIDTGKTERRHRLLPARVVVYFIMAMTLFFDDAYEEVMRKLAESLRFLRSWDQDWQVPSASALSQARARLGAAPLAELYARVARPLAGPGSPAAWLAGLRVMAIDGVQLDVPDTADNDNEFGRGTSHGLDNPYPKVKVLGLGECGTHAVIDANIGGALASERELARPLLASIGPDMLLLADRGFYSTAFWQAAADTGAQLLWRVSSTLRLHVVTELDDGSYLSVLLTPYERRRVRNEHSRGVAAVPQQGLTVRVIEYDIANRESSNPTPIRLITTIVDPELASASELAAAYHQRWEFESSLAEIETRQRGSHRVPRSHSPEMVRQEIWALLLTHYAIRTLMHEAADPEQLDPLRMSFIRTLRIVRSHVTGQAGFSP